jgi:hypothetical protein
MRRKDFGALLIIILSEVSLQTEKRRKANMFDVRD